MLRTLGRWFWIVGLGTAVLVFSGLSLASLIFAVHDRNWQLLWPAVGMALFAGESYRYFRKRSRALPGDPPPPLEDWEPPDFG